MDYIVLKTSRSIAKPFVIKHHYTKAFGKASIILGLYKVGEPELLGVITFGQCSGRLVAQSVLEGGSHETVFEFLRMCVLDDVICPRTFFMSKSISILKQNFPKIKCLVTYADQTEGHDGTVYKANSWVRVGETKPKYHYLDKEGRRLNKRLIWDWAMIEGLTETEYQLCYGYTKIDELPKIKFIKYLKKLKTNL